MTPNRLHMFALTAILLLPAWMALAQPRDRDPALEHRRQRVETVIIGKFADELNLTPEQAEKFYPLLRQFRNWADQHHRQQREIRERMESLSRDPGAGADELNSLLNRSEEGHREGIAKRREFLSQISEFLTPQQVSRCSVMLDELPRRMQALIDEQRRRTGGRRGLGN